uniref:Uncharacterized protein n=1 Tax=Arundo donax TaxID=35708 RepID=A0A0A9EL98_ARUDO
MQVQWRKHSCSLQRRSYTHDCSQFRSSIHVCARGLQQVQCNTGLVPVNSGIAHGRFQLCWSCSTGMSYF